MRKISKKKKKQTTFFTYLDEMHSGVDPGLILGCCQSFIKKDEHRNDVISKKIMIQQESSR